MKTKLLFAVGVFFSTAQLSAQVYTPIATTGYTLDAVAENTTALSTTGGVIDGSNYVLYSSAYGMLYGGSATGLPNNGLIANGTRTYQLQSYTTTNMLYVPAFNADTLIFTSPAPYPAISMLAFATEGTASMDLKVRFTDGTTQLFQNVSLDDWYTGTNTVVTGFDRASRPLGTPNYAGPQGNPKMYYLDLNLTCANAQKNIQKIVVINTDNNARICIMAVSGAAPPVFTAVSSPVTCAGGTNGSATVTVSNGVPPFTFTWPGPGPQNSNIGTALPPGLVSFTATDASTCTFVSTVSISQAIVPTAPITITASAMQVCSGYPVELTTSGAATYSWSNNGSTSTTTVNPVANNSTYSVVATTSDNCTVMGDITLNIFPLPVTSFTIPANLCITADPIPLSASPSGGTFDGGSVIFNSFYASQAGAGTHTVSYTYTDPNSGCTSVNTISTTVSNPTVVIAFTITPGSVCISAPAMTLNAQPAGGTYTGSGVSASGIFNPSVAGIGTHTVAYSYTDPNTCAYRQVSSVIVTTCSSVGIKEISADLHIEIYPNPSSGAFTIRSDKDLEFTLVNELGQTITQLELNAYNEKKVTVENIPAGIYFMKSGDGLINQKLIITK